MSGKLPHRRCARAGRSIPERAPEVFAATVVGMKKWLQYAVAALALGGIALPAAAETSAPGSAVCAKKHAKKKHRGKKRPAQTQPNVPL
jgi:hypothetical protein